MDLGLTANTWPYLVTLAMLTVLALLSLRQVDVPGAFPLLAACLLAGLWVTGMAAEFLATNIEAKVFWFKFQAVWKMPTVTATTCFALEYVSPGRWLTRRTLILLSIPPLLVLLMVLTNDLHHWYWLGFVVTDSVQPLRGGVNWLTNVYGVTIVLVNITAFIWLFIRSPQHRWPVALMIVGQIAGRTLYSVSLATGHDVMLPQPVMLGLMITVGTYSVALFGFRILDPLPAASRIAIEQMQDGMLVFDSRWLVRYLNPAAESILGISAMLARGKAWSALLPGCVDPDRCLDPGTNPIEIIFGTGNQARRNVLDLSELRDHRGLTIGYLLLLRDVTEQRRVQAQLLQNQWAQASLQERELLAQELHDGLSQNLGFLNVQAQAAGLYLKSGQDEAAEKCLNRLAEVALEMQGDTRTLIDNLLTVSLPSEGLCSVLRRAVSRFEEHTGLPVDMEIADELDTVCSSEAISPDAGVQLLRILQEALANVRKHAGSPSQIRVELTADGCQLHMTIADNGRGFDRATAGASGKRYGLQVMGQRAERIGGQMVIHSDTGQGTKVEVQVPLAGRVGGRAT